jgi:hypothetical protein
MDERTDDFAHEADDMASGNAMSSELRKRRSTRIVQAVPLAVTGVDALGRSFTERTSTLIINCHGCRYQSKHYVLKNMWVTLEIPHPESGQPPRNVRGRVAWIQRPRTVRQLFQVALELELPGNAWGMAFPPEDWFAFPESSTTPAAAATPSHAPLSGLPGMSLPSINEAPQGERPSGSGESGISLHDPELWTAMGTDNVRVFPSPASTTDAALQLARQMARLIGDAKQQIQAAARDAATHAVMNAVSAERHTAFEQWEQKFAAARVEVVHEAERAIARIRQEAAEQSNRVAAAAQELTEKTRSELAQTVAPQLQELAHGVAHEVSGKLTEEAAAQREQLAQHAANQTESLRTLCEQAGVAAASLAAQRENLAAEIHDRTAAAQKILDETRQALEERARAIEEQARKLEEHRQADEETARRRAAALTAQGEALQAAVRESEARLAELAEAHARAMDVSRALAQETANASETAATRVGTLQEEALQRYALTQATMEAGWRSQLEAEMAAARERWQEAIGATAQAAIDHAITNTIAAAREQASLDLEGQARALHAQLQEEATARLDEHIERHIDSRIEERLRGHLDRHLATLNESADRLFAEADARALQLQQSATGSAAEAEQRLTALREAAANVAGEAEQRLAALRTSLEEFVNGAFREKTERLEPLIWTAGETIGRLEQFSARLDSAQEDSLHAFRAQLDDVLTLHRNELHRRSEALFEEINGRIRAAFEDASRMSVSQFAEQVSATLQPHVTLAQEAVQQAEEAVHRLAGGRSLLDAAMTLQQDRIRGFADEAFAESLARFRESLGTVEQVLQESSQVITQRGLADLESKLEALKHRTVEDLLKSSEWYEKKAQTQIQNATERAIEHASALLREKAGEVSSAFASEVDHASRNFVGHTQSQMEEVLRDAFERSRGLFAEAAETTTAAFTDEIQRTARAELAGFGQEVHRAADEMRGQVEAARVELTLRTSAEQEDFLRRFQAGMQKAVEGSVAEARQTVEASFAPLLASVRGVTQTQQEELRGLYQKAGEAAAEEHREKLRGISNQWMLATVASLDQKARGIIAEIANNAESQLRAACDQVFATVGDSLRERMREIASGMDSKAKGHSA